MQSMCYALDTGPHFCDPIGKNIKIFLAEKIDLPRQYISNTLSFSLSKK